MKKTAIVTGASRGIGYAIAKQLGKDGFNIVMVATGSKEKNIDAIKQLEEDNINVHYVQADVSNHDDRLKIVNEAISRFNRIDVLVNNAGVAPLERMDLLEMSEESFDRVLNINTKSNLL